MNEVINCKEMIVNKVQRMFDGVLEVELTQDIDPLVGEFIGVQTRIPNVINCFVVDDYAAIANNLKFMWVNSLKRIIEQLEAIEIQGD